MTPAERAGSSWRLSTLIGLIAFTLGLGFIFRASQLVALGEALAAVVLLGWLGCRQALAGLEVRRVILDHAFEGDELTARLILSNTGRFVAYTVEVRDRYSCDAIPGRQALVLEVPPGAETAAVNFDVRASRGRGRYALGPVELAVSDVLGLFRLRRVVPLEATLVAYPRPLAAAGLDLASHLHGVFSGGAEVARAGQTTNFYGLREYRPGEPIRHLHWRASAQRDRLLVTEFEAPSQEQVTILLDLEQQNLRGVGKGSNAEVGIRVAAAVAAYATRNGQAVQLIADDGQPIVLGPKRGEQQLMAILEGLALVQPRGKVPYLDLLGRAIPVIPEGARLVLILGRKHVHAERLVELCCAWRRRGQRALAVVIDDDALFRLDEWGDAGPPPGHEPAEEVLARLGVLALPIRDPARLQEALA